MTNLLLGLALAAAVAGFVDDGARRRWLGVGLASVAVLVSLLEADWIHAGLAGMAFAGSLVGVSRWLRARRPVRLSAEELRIHRLVFRPFSPAQLQRLLAAGDWFDVEGRETLLRASKAPDEVLLVVDGEARVRQDGADKAPLLPGDFAGAIGWVTGQPVGYDVVSAGRTRYLRWTRADLDTLFRDAPELRSLFTVAVARDLASKLA